MSISGYSDAVLVALGVVLMVAGLTLLLARPEVSRGPFRAAREAAHALLSRWMSEPTRLLISVVLLVVGYHFLAWAAPAGWDPVAVPRQRWLVVVGVGVAVVILSFAMDRAGVVGSRTWPGAGGGGPAESPGQARDDRDRDSSDEEES